MGITFVAGLLCKINEIGSWGSLWASKYLLRAILPLPLWLCSFPSLSLELCLGPGCAMEPSLPSLGQCPLPREAFPRICLWRSLTSSALGCLRRPLFLLQVVITCVQLSLPPQLCSQTWDCIDHTCSKIFFLIKNWETEIGLPAIFFC